MMQAYSYHTYEVMQPTCIKLLLLSYWYKIWSEWQFQAAASAVKQSSWTNEHWIVEV